ncbi:MAG: aminotransferase class I/II-fold pyridoxal phosphate-dependent enzyme [Vicinamibacterales bacterium]
MSLFDKLQPTAERLAAAGGSPTPFDTVIERVLGPTEVVIGGRRTLMCGSNNYLGLSFHPDVIAAASEALAAEGAGTTGSRAANGTYARHRALERQFAELYGTRYARVFTTGYQANLGLVSGLCGPGDTVLLDIESHASIYDGARLSGASIFAFRHNSPDDLHRKLARQADPTRCLVIIEGLYSVSGDVAPVARMADIVREAGAFLAVDEAHAFGAYGARGLGRTEDEGALDRVDFIVGTFSKTLAGIGGYCVSNHDALRLLHFTSRPYVFTASASPANIAGVQAALEVMARGTGLRTRLWQNVRRARAGLLAAGFDIGPTESPIVPVKIGGAERTIHMWRTLLAHGLYVNIMLPPATPPDACLLRTSYSAAHTPDEVDRAVATFAEVGRALAVIPTPA